MVRSHGAFQNASDVMEPTFRQLEYVVSIAEHGSFGKAAEHCFVTQPALSAQIAQLEKVLGVQLFERGRRIRPTPAGEMVISQARKILTEVRELRDSARGLGEPLVGRIRLGVIPTVSPYLLPLILPELRTRFPRLRLSLKEALTRDLVAALHAGELDLLLLALDVEMGPVEEFVVMDDHFLLVVPPGHPLASKPELRQKDLESSKVLLLADGHCLRSHAIEACHLRPSKESDDFSASSLGTLVRLVEGGMGVTLLPEISVDAEAHKELGMKVLRFASPEPKRRIGMVWRRNCARKREYKLLASTIRKLLQGLPREKLAASAPAAVEAGG